MRKIITATAMTVLMCMLWCMTVSAEPTAEVQTVHVTIADQNGDLVLATEAVELSDLDGDKALTVNDALLAAHTTYYPSGVSGYAIVGEEQNVRIAKLWGNENNEAFGCYLNDAQEKNLLAPVKNGDRIYAFAYSDTQHLSDMYCYFDFASLNVNEGEEIVLTLKTVTYNEQQKPVVVPVANAVLTVNGELTTYVSDEQGKITLTLDGGNHIISAVSDTMILVPPVCKVMAAIDATESTQPTVNVSEATTATTSPTAVLQSSDALPAITKPDNTPVLVVSLVGIGVALVVFVCGAIMIGCSKK